MFLRLRRCQGLLGALLVVCSPALAAPRGDTNGDGKLDLAEFQAKLTARLMKADTNGGSRISLEEWQAVPPLGTGSAIRPRFSVGWTRMATAFWMTTKLPLWRSGASIVLTQTGTALSPNRRFRREGLPSSIEDAV